jgi:two-component system cell cycle response regulator DivK
MNPRYLQFYLIAVQLTDGDTLVAKAMRQHTILVVEDDERQRRLVCDLLKVKGYEVLIAENGTSGIDVAVQQQPDLILLDIRLPDISGLEVAGVLKTTPNTRAIPIVAVTAHAMPGDEQIIREKGCDAYMAKPIDIHQLLKLVTNLLCGPRYS